MNQVCGKCKALQWKEESTGMCCSAGKIRLPILQEPVQPMKDFIVDNSEESKLFLPNIRKYNLCFHKTSFGADKVVRMPGFSPTFCIQGQVYHRIGSLLPEINIEPQFLQIYFIAGAVVSVCLISYNYQLNKLPGNQYEIYYSLFLFK